jgi:hypothetical protein
MAHWGLLRQKKKKQKHFALALYSGDNRSATNFFDIIIRFVI